MLLQSGRTATDIQTGHLLLIHLIPCRENIQGPLGTIPGQNPDTEVWLFFGYLQSNFLQRIAFYPCMESIAGFQIIFGKDMRKDMALPFDIPNKHIHNVFFKPLSDSFVHFQLLSCAWEASGL
jgi:hypothetical protein